MHNLNASMSLVYHEGLLPPWVGGKKRRELQALLAEQRKLQNMHHAVSVFAADINSTQFR